MGRAHNFYFPLRVKDLQLIVEAHQAEFDQILEDTFSDEELQRFERQLDAMAAIDVQPIFSELTFDDLVADPNLEQRQRFFFEACQSSLCLDHLPYFDSNPFQVSYLKELLKHFDEVLIDRGGVEELCFKETYLNELKKYKGMESLIAAPVEKIKVSSTARPVDPIDFLVLDVYKELDRLKDNISTEQFPEKAAKLYQLMKIERLAAPMILEKSRLAPKDFEDSLEKLKFILKKLS